MDGEHTKWENKMEIRSKYLTDIFYLMFYDFSTYNCFYAY